MTHLWRRYRIRPAEYDRLREEQDYCCAICGIHECDLPVLRSGRPRLDGQPAAQPFRLVVDHCHGSGQVRGLLCQDCNIAIGCAKDSPEILRAAITYLEARNGASSPRS
ncbi:endonuclease VII domain-containing protein [Micromonospora chokoriensis]|uniref:endonuclease VII domain-containing protein n=1 Tax=Micromonospora chokoriensis TaxID=356851 RepID=UPI000689A1EB|nr:endonuclease VII domain-containing protein [Micromonospora chokoriensis]